MRMLREAAEEYFPDEFKAALQPDDGNVVVNSNSGVDAQDAAAGGAGGDEDGGGELEAELAAIRGGSAQKKLGYELFEAADTGVKGTVMVRMKLPGVAASLLASKLMHRVHDEGKQQSRRVARILPLDITCPGTEAAVGEALTKLLEGTELREHPAPLLYAIDARVRNNTALSRAVVEGLVKERVAPSHVPVYKGTDLYVLVHVCKTVAGMSVVRDFVSMHRYNPRVEGDPATRREAPALSTPSRGMASEAADSLVDILEAEGRVAMPDKGAHIDFALVDGDPKVMDITHTFVPESGRGQGLAGKLAKAAFEHAKARGWHVRPTCSYISGSFVPKNPQYQDMVSKL